MFRQLKIYYFFIALPFVLLLVGASIFHRGVAYTISRNPHPQINYTIFVIIIVGGVLVLLNARRLVREARVIRDFFDAVHANIGFDALKDLANRFTGETACLLQMVASSGGRPITHQEQVALEHEVNNSRSSLIRRNALPQYLTGLLVGMGLLGTFIGLLATLNDISTLINSFADIDMQNASPIVVFKTMIERMKAPMQSMGIAFSASMFGLLGSIVLGLMMVGIRRLQGDIFSLLSSEVARHIEIALAQGVESFANGDRDSGGAEAGGSETARALIRIEERYAEAARAQQRGLLTLSDDLQKQRADLLRALSEQTESNNALRGELQQLGRQLGSIFESMEQANGALSAGFSDLAVNLNGESRETNRLLATQVEEQQKLRSALDSYRIEERLAEAGRTQQHAVAAVADDLRRQRDEMQQALAGQAGAGNAVRGELQQLSGQLAAISNIVEQGKSDIAMQLSELTVQATADARESQLQLDTLAVELQKLGPQADGEAAESSFGEQLTELINRLVNEERKTQAQFANIGNDLRSELQRLGRRCAGGDSRKEDGEEL
jgi:hypothetical protein